MARKKRASRLIPKAEKRLSGLKSIDPQLNLGEGLTVVDLDARIQIFRKKLAGYNQILSMADALAIEIRQAEQALGQQVEAMLLAIASQYGKDSLEYAKAGGVRISDSEALTGQFASAPNDAPWSLPPLELWGSPCSSKGKPAPTTTENPCS